MTVAANGAITQLASTALTIQGNSSFAAGNHSITLSNTNNNFTGNVSFNTTTATTNNVTFNNNGPLALGASNISGGLNVTATGNITEYGTLTVNGISTFNVGNHSINLSQSGNAFTGAITLTTGTGYDINFSNTIAATAVPTISANTVGNLTLNLNRAVALPAETINGALNVTANGNITQAGVLNVAGATFLAAGSSNNITLVTTGDRFNGTVSILSGNSVNISDSIAIGLAPRT